MKYTINIELELDLKDNLTEEQIRNWVEFNVGLRGNISADNPLYIDDIDPLSGYVEVN